MRSHDEEMTMMTPPLSDLSERISPEDIALVGYLLDEILTMVNCRTYAFNITSDTLTDRGEIQ